MYVTDIESSHNNVVKESKGDSLPKMTNLERKAELVKALKRKGAIAYKQGQGYLSKYYTDVTEGYNEDGNPRKRELKHCCMGVACRVAQNNGLKELITFNDAMNKVIVAYGITAAHRETHYMPPTVREWYGIDDRYGQVGAILAHLNDTLRLTFPEIGEWIDINL